MSKMGQYIQWCLDAGYVNRQGEVYSMDHVEEYMKTQEYQEEHDEQSRKVMDSLEEQEKLRELEFAVLNEGKL